MKKYLVDYINPITEEIKAENLDDLLEKLTTQNHFGVVKEDLKSFVKKAKNLGHFEKWGDTEARLYINEMDDGREIRIIWWEDLEEDD